MASRRSVACGAGLPLASLRFSPAPIRPNGVPPSGRAGLSCPSTANEVSGASFDAGHAIEDRKGVGLKGRPPHTSAGAHTSAALPRSVSEQTEQMRAATDLLLDVNDLHAGYGKAEVLSGLA